MYPTKNSQCLFDSWQTKTNIQLKSWNQGRPAINTSHRESQSPPTSSARSPPAWHYNCFASLIVNFQKSPSIYRQCSGLKEELVFQCCMLCFFLNSWGKHGSISDKIKATTHVLCILCSSHAVYLRNPIHQCHQLVLVYSKLSIVK